MDVTCQYLILLSTFPLSHHLTPLLPHALFINLPDWLFRGCSYIVWSRKGEGRGRGYPNDHFLLWGRGKEWSKISQRVIIDHGLEDGGREFIASTSIFWWTVPCLVKNQAPFPHLIFSLQFQIKLHNKWYYLICHWYKKLDSLDGWSVATQPS